MKTTIKPRIKTIPATQSSPSMLRKLLSLSVSMVDFSQKQKRRAAYDFVIVFNLSICNQLQYNNVKNVHVVAENNIQKVQEM